MNFLNVPIPMPTQDNLVYWVIFIFASGMVYLYRSQQTQMRRYNSQAMEFHQECKDDRTVLRKKVDEQSEKINNLAERTVRAETLAGIPCDHDECPKLKMLIKKTKD